MITDRQRGHQPGAETEQLERTVLETRLQALQAQIEPHFLSTHLASIDQIQTDPLRHFYLASVRLRA